MKLFKFLVLCHLVAFLSAPAVYALAVSSDEVTANQATEQVEDPKKVHRDLFSQKDADPARLAISAGELIKLGDQSWLRTLLINKNTSEPAVLAVVSAFMFNKDISALPEILMLSMGDKNLEVVKSCDNAIYELLGNKKTRDPVGKQLVSYCVSKDTNKELLLASINALSCSSNLDGVVDILIALLGNEDESVRLQAQRTLTVLTLKEFPGDVTVWKNWWDKNRHLSRDRILQKRIEELENRIFDISTEREKLAVQIIESGPENAIQFLNHDSLPLRLKAAGVINTNESEETFKKIIEPVIQHLGGLIENPDNKYELYTVLLLEFVGKSSEKKPEVQSLLLAYLNNPHYTVSVKVAAAKSLQGFKSDELRTAVVKNLDLLREVENKATLKIELLKLLADTGCADNLDLIVFFQNQGNEKAVRKAAVKALGASKQKRAIEVLGKLLREDPEWEIRFHATDSLALLGKTGDVSVAEGDKSMTELAVTELKSGLLDKDAQVREACISELGVLNPPDVLQIIQEQLRVEIDPGVKKKCIYSLGKIKKPEGLQLICRALPQNNKAKDPKEKTNGKTFQTAQTAVESICGLDQTLWLKAIEVFFDGEQYSLVRVWCDRYKRRSKGGNGDKEAELRVKVYHAEASYKLYIQENDLPKAEENAGLLTTCLPDNIGYSRKYAQILVQVNKLKEALAEYLRLLSLLPEDQIVDLWTVRCEMADLNLSLDIPEESVRILEGYPPEGVTSLPENLTARVSKIRTKASALIEKKAKPKPEEKTNNAKDDKTKPPTKDNDKKAQGKGDANKKHDKKSADPSKKQVSIPDKKKNGAAKELKKKDGGKDA